MSNCNNFQRYGQLYLTLVEMQTIRDHFRGLDRDPTDIELETVAQTWSEHCSHKTLAGRIHYRGPAADGTPLGDERQYDNMLKETIFAATQTLRKSAGADDMCVSVFKDNAGVVKFDDKFHACFKSKRTITLRRWSLIWWREHRIGRRDPRSAGNGTRGQAVCNTDVFCFAPPDVHRRTHCHRACCIHGE